MGKKGLLTGVVIGFVLIGIWLGLRFSETSPVPAQYPDLIGDFVLSDANGNPVRLSDYRGQVALLYFGYTHCPDVCIAALSKIARALNHLSAEQRAEVQPFFISLDPERDTPEKLAAYARGFHPQITSLTGTTEQVNQVAKTFFIAHHKVPGQNDVAYDLDHSSVTYVLSRAGGVHRLVHQPESAEDLATYIRQALTGSPDR
ncbi:MAG: SCO family protein [Pseudomonadota bacterium]